MPSVTLRSRTSSSFKQSIMRCKLFPTSSAVVFSLTSQHLVAQEQSSSRVIQEVQLASRLDKKTKARLQHVRMTRTTHLPLGFPPHEDYPRNSALNVEHTDWAVQTLRASAPRGENEKGVVLRTSFFHSFPTRLSSFQDAVPPLRHHFEGRTKARRPKARVHKEMTPCEPTLLVKQI